MEELKDYLSNQYAKVEQLRELRREVIPAVKEFRKQMQGYSNGYEQMKEMVRRFDEVLSEKASKMAVNEL